ncbi:MAG: ABC transporter permease [Chitinivibrionia bacterium]|nr:ABC transporter permease [Chitinivibrionia bacterium]
MARFILRRVLSAGVLVLITLTLTFLAARLAPGDPLNRYYSPEVDPELIPRVRQQFGFDKSLLEQYGRWIWNFLQGDFGVSFSESRPVAAILRETVPRTLQLTVLALGLQILLGIGLGMLMAARRGTRTERSLMLAFLAFYSIPSFYLAYLLIALFSLKLGLLPAANMGSLHLEPSGWLLLKDRALHMAMPVFVLAFGGAAGLARFTRGSLIDVFGEDYIRTARAQGLSSGRVLWIHAFRNALAPVLTVMGLSFPFLLGGSVVVEKIFAWPGMGALTVDAIFSRDYPVIMAATFIGACMVIAGSLLSDIFYGIANPRIKLAVCKGNKTD